MTFFSIWSDSWLIEIVSKFFPAKRNLSHWRSVGQVWVTGDRSIRRSGYLTTWRSCHPVMPSHAHPANQSSSLAAVWQLGQPASRPCGHLVILLSNHLAIRQSDHSTIPLASNPVSHPAKCVPNAYQVFYHSFTAEWGDITPFFSWFCPYLRHPTTTHDDPNHYWAHFMT